jgi:hypothetical protein
MCAVGKAGLSQAWLRYRRLFRSGSIKFGTVESSIAMQSWICAPQASFLGVPVLLSIRHSTSSTACKNLRVKALDFQLYLIYAT